MSDNNFFSSNAEGSLFNDILGLNNHSAASQSNFTNFTGAPSSFGTSNNSAAFTGNSNNPLLQAQESQAAMFLLNNYRTNPSIAAFVNMEMATNGTSLNNGTFNPFDPRELQGMASATSDYVNLENALTSAGPNSGQSVFNSAFQSKAAATGLSNYQPGNGTLSQDSAYLTLMNGMMGAFSAVSSPANQSTNEFNSNAFAAYQMATGLSGAAALSAFTSMNNANNSASLQQANPNLGANAGLGTGAGSAVGGLGTGAGTGNTISVNPDGGGIDPNAGNDASDPSDPSDDSDDSDDDDDTVTYGDDGDASDSASDASTSSAASTKQKKAKSAKSNKHAKKSKKHTAKESAKGKAKKKHKSKESEESLVGKHESKSKSQSKSNSAVSNSRHKGLERAQKAATQHREATHAAAHQAAEHHASAHRGGRSR